jgi:hypothetical protein
LDFFKEFETSEINSSPQWHTRSRCLSFQTPIETHVLEENVYCVDNKAVGKEKEKSVTKWKRVTEGKQSDGGKKSAFKYTRLVRKV